MEMELQILDVMQQVLDAMIPWKDIMRKELLKVIFHHAEIVMTR